MSGRFDPDQPWTEYDMERLSLDASEPEEDEVLDVRRKCALCGRVYTPWPEHDQCSNCGQRPKAEAS